MPIVKFESEFTLVCFIGIGIDDMFVIVQCWYNLKEEEVLGKDLAEKIGLTMKHAGVAITVTSVTDVFAFGIGAVTVIFRNNFRVTRATFQTFSY
jgi:hypothetical protein